MSRSLKATVLVENGLTRCSRLACEHGLSLHLAYGGLRILLDFGQTDAFVRNAGALGVDLAHVDHAVLSHAHYDHADGMPAFFTRNATAPLHLSAACTETCWSTKGGTAEAHAHLSCSPTRCPTASAPCIRDPRSRSEGDGARGAGHLAPQHLKPTATPP